MTPTPIEIAICEFHSAARAENAALERIMAEAGAIDPMHHRTKWKALVFNSEGRRDPVEFIRHYAAKDGLTKREGDQ